MDFKERKKERTKHYFQFEYRWKLRECCACSGSGYYDNNESPPCSSCEGYRKRKI